MMRKRILSMILVLALMVSMMPTAFASADSSSAEAAETVRQEEGSDLRQLELPQEPLSTLPSGIITGDGLTRQQWMRNLVLLFKLQLTKAEYPDRYFPDISESTKYYKDIMIATKYGVVDIEAGDNFLPDELLTRDFAASTLNFLLGREPAEASSFTDADAIAHPEAAQVAVELGWFQPVDGAFLPDQPVAAAEITAMLNHKSGLLGVSGVSNDCRTIEAAALSGNKRAQLALDIFHYRVAKYVAAMTVAAGRLDALVFTGGIGENSKTSRAKIVGQLGFLGLQIDDQLNAEARFGQAGIITKSYNPLAMVVPTNEELMIAKDTARLAGLTSA